MFSGFVALGDKAVAAAPTSTLPPDIIKIIDEAKRYPQGAAVRIEVYDAADARVVKILAKIKIEN